MKLNPVDRSTLDVSRVYMIDGTRCRFVRQEGNGKHIKYVFQPLSGQRKTAEVSLNPTRLVIRCQEVEGMVYQPPNNQSIIQMGLL